MKRKSIVRQVSERLHSMQAYGHSKHQDKAANQNKPKIDKIYSHSTMENYHKSGIRFAKWARENHGCRTLDEARRHTGEYLQSRIDGGASAWTVRADAAAIAKIYQCKTADLGATLPIRHRGNVTQHRQGKEAGHFSAAKNKDLVDLCKATGLRRHEVEHLRPSDVYRDGDAVKVHVRQGKGGKERIVTALDDKPIRIAQAAAKAGQDRVIGHIPKYAPIHAYRADFAQSLYDRLARPIESIPTADRYVCRADRAGAVLDKSAMRTVSAALGHARIGVVTNYLQRQK